GMDTFIPVYGTFEQPQDALIDTYVNRAHNDILELGLEAGGFGVVLIFALLAWFALSSLRLWRHGLPGAQIDTNLARAATLCVGLVIAHSLVDYPLRTQTMMALVAFACGLLVEGPVGPERGDGNQEGARKRGDTIATTAKPRVDAPPAAVEQAS